MPKPQERNQEETKVIFQSWLEDKLTSASDVKVEILGGPENTGFSNETLSFQVSYSLNNENLSKGMVLRFYPEGFFVFPDYDIHKQFLIMQKLSAHNIKVPNVLWYEESDEVFGTSFYVMEMAEGDAPSDNPPFHQEGWVADSSEEIREKIWWGWVEEMSKVHQVDISTGEYEFLNRPELGDNYLDQELNYYLNFHEWAMEGEAHPVADQARDWLVANKPVSNQSSIIWGDSRCANIMYLPNGEISAVLDWEMASLGDPCMDLAWGIAIDDCNSKGVGAERLSGFPGPVATIAKWEALTGFSADNFDYFYTLALYKFTVIMIKVVRKLEHYEIMPMGLNAHINNHVTPMLEAKLKEL